MRRALHVIGAFGAMSEGFLIDRLVELEQAGWESWVGTLSVANRDVFPFPPDDRLLRPRPWSLPVRLAARISRQWASSKASVWPMERFIDAAKPQVVHAHFGWTAAEVVSAVKSAGLPLVAGFHGYDATVFPRHGFIDPGSESAPPPLAQDPYRDLFDSADCVMAVSCFVEGKLREAGYRGRVEVVPSGIRLDEFPFRGPRTTDGECRLLFVGRQVAYKGLDVLLRALGQLDMRSQKFRLDVIGDGPTLECSRVLAEEIGLGDRVAFHGEQPRTVVARELHGADVLVAPSRTMPSGQAEGLSNVVKEALAVGVQVVATRNGGIPEVIPAQYREELVPENDDAALAERLVWVTEQRSDWPERARFGRAWVEANFDWTRLAGRITSMYEDLAAGTGARAA